MCRTEEEGVSGVDSAHVATAPSVSSKEGACRPLPLGPPTRRPRPRRPLTGARRAALVTLLCAAAAAIGASRGWYGASWWTNIGKGKDESAVDLFKERLNISTSGAESRQRRSWRRPIGGVFRRVFGGKDGNRKGHQQQQQQQQQRLAAAREEEENQQWRAHEEEALPPKKDAKRTSRKGRSEPSKDRDESASHPEGDPQESSPSTKRKRRALRSWWRRFLAKAGISVTKKVKRDGVVDAKARLVEELRKRLEQHPEELLPRAKAVLHELDDTMLLRYLEMAFWTMETGGKPLAEAIGDSVRWREEVGPHRVTEGEVVEEAEHGKLYVRGHDREGRPIIHYSPGLEISFDTEKGLKLLFYTLERARTMLPRGQNQFAVIVNCDGFGPSKTPPLAMLKTAFRAMQNHYPMRLGYVVMVNTGGPIALVWKIISAVLDDRTKAKISFLTRKEAPARLARHVDPTCLPSSLPGGLDPFRYSNKAYLLT